MPAKPKRGRPFGPRRRICIQGEEHTLDEWSAIYEVPVTTILNRVARGMSWELAVIKKVRGYRTRKESEGAA